MPPSTHKVKLFVIKKKKSGTQPIVYVYLFIHLAVWFQLQYWGVKQKQDTASVIRTVGNKTSLLIRDLEGSSTYHMSLRAYNSAGVGPSSNIVNVTTKKPRKGF